MLGFGGHKYAAGITVEADKIDIFRDAINEVARNTLSKDDLFPVLKVDAQVPLSMLNLKIAYSIEELAPFGIGNPKPVFCSRNIKVKSQPVILGRDTIKFWVTDGKLTAQVIGFGMADVLNIVANAKHVDIAYSVSVDTWQSDPQIQLELKDVKAS